MENRVGEDSSEVDRAGEKSDAKARSTSEQVWQLDVYKATKGKSVANVVCFGKLAPYDDFVGKVHKSRR